jgi:hypothetical protein
MLYNMSYELVKADTSDSFLILSLLLGILFFFYIYPNIINQSKKENFLIDDKINNLIKITDQNIPKTNQNIPKTDQNIPKIDQNICSKQCCKFIQWPIPFNTRNPIINDATLNDFIPSNLSCNGGTNGGCVCLTKNDFNYLSNHGQ